MSWPTVVWNDGNLQVAKRCSFPVLNCPIPGVNTPYILEEYWQQMLLDSTTFTPLALNTAHGEYAGFVLVEENDFQDVGGSMLRWKRTYAKVPANHYEWETYNYKFPGIIDIGNIGTSTRTSRNPVSENVTSRIKHEYFLVGTGGTYTDAGAIPKIYATQFLMQGTLDGSTVGALWAPTDVLSNGEYTLGGAYYAATTPTTSDWEKMVTDAAHNGWSATATVQDIQTDTGTNSAWVNLPGVGGSTTVYGGIVTAEDSRVTRWRGNIYLRTTRQVLAM